ncbi:MAG: homocysteine S-methyltransferase family protein [candidate division WOR-3 bacterium]
MRPLRERIAAGETILADGALGSLLIERGLQPGQAPEEFCLTQPGLLKEIVRLYQDAGAEVFQANTFGASPLKLTRHGLADRAAEINRQAVAIVREVVRGNGYVWASVGPSGQLLKPYGDTEPGTVLENYTVQARALAEAKPDLIAVETMTDLAEAVLAVRAVRQANPDMLLVATMTFERSKRGFFTIMGNSIPQTAQSLVEAGADLVGSNCGNGIEKMVEIAREFRRVTDRPLVIRPNAGLPDITEGQPVYPETPEFMATCVPELLETKLGILGGCCGTTPAHIREFRHVLDARRCGPGSERTKASEIQS